MRWLSATALCGALSLIVGCQTVPVTGRSQLNMISDDKLIASADQGFAQLMAAANQKHAVLTAAESPQAAATVATVQRVAAKIVQASGFQFQRPVEVTVLKSTTINAFAMPNGKIVVFTGLFPIAKNEAGLAAVLGHEVGHVVAHHAAERASQALLGQMALVTADAALAASSKNNRYQPTISAALGVGFTYGVLLPFSREHESEADHLGLIYMAKAGYDPAEAVDLWRRMEAASPTNNQWAFLSTHPSNATRIGQIREWLPEANLYYGDHNRPLPHNLMEMRQAKLDQDARLASAPAALLPTINSGFWFRVKSSNNATPSTFTVRSRESCTYGTCLVFAGDNGFNRTMTDQLSLVETRSPDGSWTRWSPPLPLARFPLHVGDSWSQAVTVETSSGRKASGTFKAEVVDYESVTVPSGTYMAHKISMAADGKRYSESWFSPETGFFVKQIFYDPQGREIVSDLLDYDKQARIQLEK